MSLRDALETIADCIQRTQDRTRRVEASLADLARRVATLEGAIADLRSDERSDVSVVGRVDGVRGTREAAEPTLYSLQRALASPPSG